MGISRADAEALDRADPLGPFRSRFVITDDRIYLDGNSLGRLPRRSVERLAHVVAEEWGHGLVGSWDHWIDLPLEIGDRIGALVGAGPGQVAVADSTTVNLYRLAAAALAARPDRKVIVGRAAEFPTDRYVLAGLGAEHDRTVRLTDGDPAELLDGQVALLCLSHVDFRTGHLGDLDGLTAAAHAAGALVLWDLSHSAGAVPVTLDHSGADLAVGCTYKHLLAGPGAPAWLYVRADLQARLRPPIWGWFAQRGQFAMGPTFEPADGMTGWLTGTPAVLGLAAVDEGVRLVTEAGVDAIRAKGVALNRLVLDRCRATVEPLGARIVSPGDPARCGAHVSVAHPEAWRVCRALIERLGVVPDFRPPDVIRLGLSPLTTGFAEAWEGVERLRRALAERAYEAFDPAPGRVT